MSKVRRVLILVFILLTVAMNGFSQTYYRLDATNNGQVINLTCPVANSRFADDGSNSTHYSNNIDYTLTFCAPAGKLLNFNFGCGSNLTTERIHSSDTLFIYDGNSTSAPLMYSVTGNPGNTNRLPYFDEASIFEFTSPSSCITFRLKSGVSNNEDGWDACITCVDPIVCGNGNSPASDLFGGAPYICNFTNYCGVTSGDFGEDYPVNLNAAGGSCPSGTNFLGTIENNSWLKFVADSTVAIFDFNVPLGGTCLNGIQTAILSYDGIALTRMSPCAFTDGSHSGNFQLIGSGLTVGSTYYLMTDGNAGDICNYFINANAGVNILNAGPDQIICITDPLNLTAEGPLGATYTWNSLDGMVNNQVGISQTFFPNVNTTYVVEISSGVCANQAFDTVEVSMCNSLSVDLKYFSAECRENSIHLNWETTNESNLNYFLLEKANSNGVFYSLTTLVASNLSNGSFYSFIDFDTEPLINYYQLSEVDFNGNKNILKTISIRNDCSNNEVNLHIYPNPATDYTNLELQLGEESKVSIKIIDVLGREVLGSILENQLLGEGTHVINVFTDKLSSAIYYLLVFIDDERFILPFNKIFSITN